MLWEKITADFTVEMPRGPSVKGKGPANRATFLPQNTKPLLPYAL